MIAILPGRRRRVIKTRKSLARRAWIALRIALLRWMLAADEAYIRECAEEGLLDSLSLRAWRDQTQATRVRIALLEASDF